MKSAAKRHHRVHTHLWDVKQCHAVLEARGVEAQGVCFQGVAKAHGVWEVLCLVAAVPAIQTVVALFAKMLVPGVRRGQ